MLLPVFNAIPGRPSLAAVPAGRPDPRSLTASTPRRCRFSMRCAVFDPVTLSCSLQAPDSNPSNQVPSAQLGSWSRAAGKTAWLDQSWMFTACSSRPRSPSLPVSCRGRRLPSASGEVDFSPPSGSARATEVARPQALDQSGVPRCSARGCRWEPHARTARALVKRSGSSPLRRSLCQSRDRKQRHRPERHAVETAVCDASDAALEHPVPSLGPEARRWSASEASATSAADRRHLRRRNPADPFIVINHAVGIVRTGRRSWHLSGCSEREAALWVRQRG